MKTRTLILLIASAVITLSFSLGATLSRTSGKQKVAQKNNTEVSAPVGGLAADDRP